MRLTVSSLYLSGHDRPRPLDTIRAYLHAVFLADGVGVLIGGGLEERELVFLALPAECLVALGTGD